MPTWDVESRFTVRDDRLRRLNLDLCEPFAEIFQASLIPSFLVVSIVELGILRKNERHPFVPQDEVLPQSK